MLIFIRIPTEDVEKVVYGSRLREINQSYKYKFLSHQNLGSVLKNIAKEMSVIKQRREPRTDSRDTSMSFGKKDKTV